MKNSFGLTSFSVVGWYYIHNFRISIQFLMTRFTWIVTWSAKHLCRIHKLQKKAVWFTDRLSDCGILLTLMCVICSNLKLNKQHNYFPFIWTIRFRFLCLICVKVERCIQFDFFYDSKVECNQIFTLTNNKQLITKLSFRIEIQFFYLWNASYSTISQLFYYSLNFFFIFFIYNRQITSLNSK